MTEKAVCCSSRGLDTLKESGHLLCENSKITGFVFMQSQVGFMRS